MKRVLIFSGTTEGKELADLLAEQEIPATVCVATEYGSQVMDIRPGIVLHQGRMDADAMQGFISPETYAAVVDATHPFAAQVTENIRQSAHARGVPYLRLRRDGIVQTGGAAQEGFSEDAFASHEACAAALLESEGKILLTTGSKDLSVYCKDGRLRERLHVRVLPSEESIAVCRECGLKGSQIIAMQGPFSREVNLALIRQYGIRHLVTKESGRNGGLAEKIEAAREAGIHLCVITNPETQKSLSLGEVCRELEFLTGRKIRAPLRMNISLVGAGMGDLDSLTGKARKEIEKAEILFGAKRLTDCAAAWKLCGEDTKICSAYTAGEILPVLDTALEELQSRGWQKRILNAAVLFSGDSGFYSGCAGLYEKLLAWKKEAESGRNPEETGRAVQISVQICPGISSVSYFAAACVLSWQDAWIGSIHGKGERSLWEAQILGAVRSHEKVFLLVSGASDVRSVGQLLTEYGMEQCRIFVGYQLASSEERIIECTSQSCAQITKEGLYILAVLNPGHRKPYLAPCRQDADFIRGKVPMSKEAVRALIICRLKLTEDAVVYDVGSGTGSVAVEIAERSEKIRVYALEQKEEGIDLIRQNKERFGLANLVTVLGRAPDSFRGLPVPTHAFIGGSGGGLLPILEALRQMNPYMRVVVTAVTLETVSELTGILKLSYIKNAEILYLQAGKAKEAGNYHLFNAENPVYLYSFDLSEE